MFFKNKKDSGKTTTKIEFVTNSEPVVNIYDASNNLVATSSFPEHKELDNVTWVYNKMEDVPIPENEEWVWVDCYKALAKDYDVQKKKVVFRGPELKFLYEFNTVYALSETSEEKISYCGKGFHACLTLKDALSWYDYFYIRYVYDDSLINYLALKANLIVVAKAKLLVNKKDLDNNFGEEQLQNGKIVGKAIILTELVDEEAIFSNRAKDAVWNINCFDEDILKTFFQSNEFTENVFKSVLKNIPIDFADYLAISTFIDNGYTAMEAYTEAEIAAFTQIYKNHKKILENNFGAILTTEIFNNLDCHFALQLADTDDSFVNSLTVAEKMNILYLHKTALK